MAEQSTEEWLPVGWTVEIRVRRNGKKDRCFADPSKEHKFNSKPEVLRYLKSMESIPESEGKRRSSRNRPSPDSPAVAVRVHVDDSGTNGQNISNQTSEAVEMLKDKRILESCAGGEETSVLDQKEKNEAIDGVYDSVILPDDPSQNMPEVGKNGNKILQIGNNNKSKNNERKPELPRRASKRLAGVEVGPISELIPNNKTPRISVRQMDDTDAATVESFSAEENKHDSPQMHFAKAIIAEDNKHGCPSEGCSMPKEQILQTETSNDKIDNVASSSVEVCLEDFWMDPCIEFAIKTLTGQIPIEEELGKNKNPTNIPEPSSELTSVDLWGDPCIEFAVKTLTGDIPFDELSFQNHFQKMDKGSDFSLGL